MKCRIFSLLLILLSFSANGQSLDEQFNTLVEDAETFKAYKVIKQTELKSFWNSVLDTLDNKETKYVASQSKVAAQADEILQKESTIQELNEKIAGLQHDTSHITFLGIDFQKQTYIIFNVVIILGLVIFLGLLYIKFKDSIKVARKKSTEFKKLDSEYEEYKKKALEKQMKLRRDLQTVTNRLDEIRST